MDHLWIGALLRPLFWITVLGLALWAVRRAFPSLEEDLFEKGPIDGAIGLIRKMRSRVRALRDRRRER